MSNVNLGKILQGHLWWSVAKTPPPMQGAQIRSLVKELDNRSVKEPTCCNKIAKIQCNKK